MYGYTIIIIVLTDTEPKPLVCVGLTQTRPNNTIYRFLAIYFLGVHFFLAFNPKAGQEDNIVYRNK